MSVIVNYLFNVNLSDINAQPKIFSKFLKKFLKLFPKRLFACLFFLLLAQKNLKIVEHPVFLHERKKGKSQGWRNIVRKNQINSQDV